jgi:voltage-gated potassium channel
MRDFIFFTRHLFRMLFFVRGVLLILLMVLVAFALITAKVDNISLTDAHYLVFITALTVGFGDITPNSGVTRTIMVLAGCVGVILVGLVVAVSTRALKLAVEDAKQLQRGKLSGDKER